MSKRRQRPSKKESDRGEFLSQLVQEYLVTRSLEAKQQVLANLANFAYDPINYEHLWQANAIDLFINGLEDPDPSLREFGTGGLANVCSDPNHRQYIFLQPECIDALKKTVSDAVNSTQAQDETVINAMTTLMLLIEPSSQQAICTHDLKKGLEQLRSSEDKNPRVRTMATLFLNDYFH
ncbi:hypothetical protein O0I10_004725 [Lichtheimia ornata]|uniref:Armadillo repeat-containing protein 7 n=1 Tax=Lichtheimia ornata TaxID=688661 RepID=A0AAD7V5T7_9FUNG|nr:uncharacterized protein O0I10_004725 [Lichtheimia ornata]KAJ8659365.1 hypothetical protein O0I10_004725 [Lichtheimia ornata]